MTPTQRRSSEVADHDAGKLIEEAVALREDLLVLSTRLAVFSEQLQEAVSDLKRTTRTEEQGA